MNPPGLGERQRAGHNCIYGDQMTSNNSPFFDKKLFIKLAHPPWSEGPRLDYKQEVFSCRNDEEKFKFIKVLIALANVSRRIGQASYILFGVEDKTFEIMDIRDQYVGNKISAIWDNPKVGFQAKQRECVIDRLIMIAKDWIAPEIPNFDYEYGDIDGKFVSYMIIKPTLTSKPFSIRRQFNNFLEGTVFIRKGSNSLPVNPSETDYVLPISSSAYLSRQDWEQIINYQLAGDFWDSINLFPTIELFVDDNPPTPALNYLRNSLLENPQKTMLIGNLGMGKSVLLRKLAYSIADTAKNSIFFLRTYYGEDNNGDENWIASIANEVEVLPQTTVPLFFNLRFSFTTESELENYLVHNIYEKTGVDLKSGIQSLFKIPGSKWALILDGLDELRISHISGPILRSWIEKLPRNVSVCVSSRPNDECPESFNIVTLSAIHQNDVAGFIINSIKSKIGDEIYEYDPNTIFEISKWLDNNQEIFPLINNLRAIQAFLNLLIPMPNPQVEVDSNKVIFESKTLESPSSFTSKIKKGDLPVISELLIMGDDSLLDSIHETETTETELKKIIMPHLALAYKFIVDYIEEEEIKRRQDFGINTKKVAEQARMNLEKIAWNSDWSSNEINMSKHPEQYLDQRMSIWYEETGFFITTSPKNPYIYKYACTALMFFFAAEFAFFTKNTLEDIKSDRKRRFPQEGFPNQETKKVLMMLNQLRIENGKNEFTFS